MCPARAAALKGDDFSCMHLDSSSKHSAPFLLFLDLLDIFRFRVWMPSFFMVSGLLTWGQAATEPLGEVAYHTDPSKLSPQVKRGCYTYPLGDRNCTFSPDPLLLTKAPLSLPCHLFKEEWMV